MWLKKILLAAPQCSPLGENDGKWLKMMDTHGVLAPSEPDFFAMAHRYFWVFLGIWIPHLDGSKWSKWSCWKRGSRSPLACISESWERSRSTWPGNITGNPWSFPWRSWGLHIMEWICGGKSTENPWSSSQHKRLLDGSRLSSEPLLGSSVPLWNDHHKLVSPWNWHSYNEVKPSIGWFNMESWQAQLQLPWSHLTIPYANETWQWAIP